MNIIKFITTSFIMLTTLLSSEAARAQEDDRENAPKANVFVYGETCEGLGQLSRVELVGITHPVYAEQFTQFCKPDSVYRCDDYNSLLTGLGHLEDNGRQSCRYLPNEK